MKSSKARLLNAALALGAILAVAYIAMGIPAPGSKRQKLDGTVIVAERTGGSRLEGGMRGFVLVRLDDGTIVSVPASRLTLPDPGARVSVVIRSGLFGQRLIIAASYASPKPSG